MQQNSPEGILVRLKNKICHALGITNTTMRLLIDNFVAVNFGNKKVGSHYMRVNMYNEISSPRMTIKVFFKFLVILQLRKIEFNVKVTTRRGAVHEISDEIDFIANFDPKSIVKQSKEDKEG